jgi:glutamyl-tRNA synthetase
MASPTPIKTRLAPTPSGYLHAGNAINFIINTVVAKSRSGGRVLLRIDDIDADRKRPEYVEDIFRTLEWLGIEWDEGPTGPDDFEQNWSQWKRIDQYEVFLAVLRDKKLVFPCQKSRKDLLAFNGTYPETFKNQSIGLLDTDTAWRADTPVDCPLPCFIVRRRDGKPAYHVASICDDVYFAVTDIVRGEDLKDTSTVQQWLAQMAGYHTFQQIAISHHPLLKDALGAKLSKSAGSRAIRDLGNFKAEKVKLFQQAAKWLGFSDTNIQNLTDLAAFYRSKV